MGVQSTRHLIVGVHTIVVGPLDVNAYIVVDPETRDGVIIDPGGEPSRILAKTRALSVRPVLILNTHAHADHIGGNEAIKATTLAPLAVHRLEASWLADPQLNMSALMGEPVVSPPADILFEHEYRFQMCGLDIFVRHTPGHTPGSSSFLIGNTLFCGDALFRESVGRTDLPEGSHDQLIESIRQQILTLPDDTRICPGHGPFTTVEHERANNPFL